MKKPFIELDIYCKKCYNIYVKAKHILNLVTYRNYKLLSDNPFFYDIKLNGYLHLIKPWCCKEFIKFIELYGYEATSKVTGVSIATLRYRKMRASRMLKPRLGVNIKTKKSKSFVAKARKKLKQTAWKKIKPYFKYEAYVLTPKERHKVKLFILRYGIKELCKISHKSEEEINKKIKKQTNYIDEILRGIK